MRNVIALVVAAAKECEAKLTPEQQQASYKAAGEAVRASEPTR